MLSINFVAQKVGLVLSGGGALGLAHIGVLKALEENNIPVDCITGTSAGAMVGSMYAVGWTPEVMNQLVVSDHFNLMTSGGMPKPLSYFFRQMPDDPSWVNVRLTKDFSLTKIIPTNVTNPVLLDFESMAYYSPLNAIANYDFDSLFVPFRCVAGDVSSKSGVVLKSGHLNQAVRASMTYPGYFKPIKINGRLMFDGGLYNNFPTDVMYDEFYPDIIIGVNFTDTATPPDEDDIFSQIKTMIINRNPSSIVCENGILIEPDEPISIFGFSEGYKAIQAGYDAAIAQMDDIKRLIKRRTTPEELLNRRKNFYSKITPLVFEDVEITGVSDNIARYIKKSLFPNEKEVELEELKKRYFKLIADDKIKFIYPMAQYNEATGKYTLLLNVDVEKPFSVKFGGVISSKPINTGYVGLKYSKIDKVGFQAMGESHFGKYYGSAKASTKFDFNFKFPFSVEGYFTLNRFDFFKNFTTFFEESKPSFIVENESFGGANLILPVGNFGKLSLGASTGRVESKYYQSDEFTPSDTTDKTLIEGNSARIEYLQSSLNKKQFASSGGLLQLSAIYFDGTENTKPGSTSTLLFPAKDRKQEYLNLRLKAQKYFRISQSYSLGISADGSALYTERFLDNYTSSIINAPSFQPTNESKAMFINEYATHFFAAGGIQNVISITNSIDFRLEGYVFYSPIPIAKNRFNQPFYSDNKGLNLLQKTSIIGSSSVVFHSPLGPLSLSLNYYEAKEKPLSFIISFGYIIHNNRFLK